VRRARRPIFRDVLSIVVPFPDYSHSGGGSLHNSTRLPGTEMTMLPPVVPNLGIERSGEGLLLNPNQGYFADWMTTN
jgi:hypothetical protein